MTTKHQLNYPWYPWDKAPPWANYAATDHCGRAQWFEFQPSSDAYDGCLRWLVFSGRFLAVDQKKERICHAWADTLQARPVAKPKKARMTAKPKPKKVRKQWYIVFRCRSEADAMAGVAAVADLLPEAPRGQVVFMPLVKGGVK